MQPEDERQFPQSGVGYRGQQAREAGGGDKHQVRPRQERPPEKWARRSQGGGEADLLPQPRALGIAPGHQWHSRDADPIDGLLRGQTTPAPARLRIVGLGRDHVDAPTPVAEKPREGRAHRGYAGRLGMEVDGPELKVAPQSAPPVRSRYSGLGQWRSPFRGSKAIPRSRRTGQQPCSTRTSSPGVSTWSRLSEALISKPEQKCRGSRSSRRRWPSSRARRASRCLSFCPRGCLTGALAYTWLLCQHPRRIEGVAPSAGTVAIPDAVRASLRCPACGGTFTKTQQGEVPRRLFIHGRPGRRAPLGRRGGRLGLRDGADAGTSIADPGATAEARVRRLLDQRGDAAGTGARRAAARDGGEAGGGARPAPRGQPGQGRGRRARLPQPLPRRRWYRTAAGELASQASVSVGLRTPRGDGADQRRVRLREPDRPGDRCRRPRCRHLATRSLGSWSSPAPRHPRVLRQRPGRARSTASPPPSQPG